MFGGIVRLLVPPLLLAAMSLVASPAQAQTFGPTVNVSNTRFDADSFSNQMAVADSNVYVVWSEKSSVLFSRSIGGSSFSTPTSLFPTGDANTTVAASVDVACVAEGRRAKPKVASQVYIRCSTDHGATFGREVQLSHSNAPSSSGAFFNSMAVSGSYVYVVWREWFGGKWEVFFARSDNSGATFYDPVQVSNASSTYALGVVKLVADGLNVHVAWSEDIGGGVQRIYYNRSTNGGQTFPGGPIKMSNNDTSDTSSNFFPVLAVSGPWVYLAWIEHAACAQLSCQPGEAPNHIFFRRSGNYGGTFELVQDLTDIPPYGGPPGLAVSGSDVHVIWLSPDSSGIYNVFYTGSINNGVSFDVPLDVSTPHGAPDWNQGAVAANGTHVYIAWSGGPSTARDIYLVHSVDSGLNFTQSSFPATAGDSQNPKAIAALGAVHVLWLDRTPGNWEVFYAHGTVPLP